MFNMAKYIRGFSTLLAYCAEEDVTDKFYKGRILW